MRYTGFKFLERSVLLFLRAVSRHQVSHETHQFPALAIDGHEDSMLYREALSSA
jgi:hypothetical protein